MNAINWFEISVVNLDRATRFYGEVLGTPLLRHVFGGSPIAVFPYERMGGVGGCLTSHDSRRPSEDGPALFLAVKDLDASLARLKEAGGELVSPRSEIGEHGFIAMIRDTEGNVVGLHEPRP
jgi:predicted enzyme related to lactoylglutathione lyase